MEWLLIIVGILLFIASVIDWKFKALPSIMMTALLFVVAFLNISNLWFGVMAFLMAYLLYEAQFFSGVADIKVMTTLGFMLNTTNWLMIMILFTVVLGFFWKVIIKLKLRKNDSDVAFLPVLFLVYVALLILGGIK